MKAIKLLSHILVVSLLAIPTFAREGGGEKSCQRNLDKLELSVAQKQQLDVFRKADRESMKSLKMNLRSIKGDLENGFVAGLNEARLRPLHLKISEIKGMMGDAKFKKMMFLKSILTDDQRKKFIEFKKENRHKRKG